MLKFPFKKINSIFNFFAHAHSDVHLVNNTQSTLFMFTLSFQNTKWKFSQLLHHSYQTHHPCLSPNLMHPSALLHPPPHPHLSYVPPLSPAVCDTQKLLGRHFLRDVTLSCTLSLLAGGHKLLQGCSQREDGVGARRRAANVPNVEKQICSLTPASFSSFSFVFKHSASFWEKRLKPGCVLKLSW